MEGLRAAVEKIQETGRKIFEAFVAQRPDWRPLEPGRWIGRVRDRLRIVGLTYRRLACPVLRVAVQQDVIGKNTVARREIREPPLHPDLVALKNPRITLDCLHQRAGFTLLGGAALAEAAASQSRPELIDVLGWRRKIMRRIKVGVH